MMQHLALLPLFADLPQNILTSYDSRCHWRIYEDGETIIDHKEASNDVRFIVSGTVRIIVRMMEGREVIFNDLESGGFFGELSAIDGGTRSASVSARAKTCICTMPQVVFEELAKNHPDIAWRVMQHLTKMIRHLSSRLQEFSFLKAKHRLYAELLRQSKPRGDSKQRIISPSPLQSDIADRISSRREIVSREMKDLERKGILERTRGGLVILDVTKLGNMAAEGWMS